MRLNFSGYIIRGGDEEEAPVIGNQLFDSPVWASNFWGFGRKCRRVCGVVFRGMVWVVEGRRGSYFLSWKSELCPWIQWRAATILSNG